MSTIRNLAMTPQELSGAAVPPEGAAWMSCHFTPEGPGLTDLPQALPPHALVILDDRTPMGSQEPGEILSILSELQQRLSFDGLLLDFQRTGSPAQQALASLLSRELSCPVGVSEAYAQQTEGPVFLPMLPAHRPLAPYLHPWKGREIWLELGRGAEQAVVTESGTVFSPLVPPFAPCPLFHRELHCHYGIYPQDRQILFTLQRTPEDLQALEQQARELGVSRTIGLYQELSGA